MKRIQNYKHALISCTVAVACTTILGFSATHSVAYAENEPKFGVGEMQSSLTDTSTDSQQNDMEVSIAQLSEVSSRNVASVRQIAAQKEEELKQAQEARKAQEAAQQAEQARKAQEAAQQKAASAQPAAQTSAPSGSYRYVGASTYGHGDGLMGARCADGSPVTETSMGVAMKCVPLGTIVEITYQGKCVRARVADRGPFVKGREIDMQPAVARALGFSGTGQVGFRVVG